MHLGTAFFWGGGAKQPLCQAYTETHQGEVERPLECEVTPLGTTSNVMFPLELGTQRCPFPCRPSITLLARTRPTGDCAGRQGASAFHPHPSDGAGVHQGEIGVSHLKGRQAGGASAGGGTRQPALMLVNLGDEPRTEASTQGAQYDSPPCGKSTARRPL